MQDEMWTPEDVERVFKIKPATVRLWCRKGLFPARKMGKLWRFKRADLESFFVSNQGGPKKANGLAAFAN